MVYKWKSHWCGKSCQRHKQSHNRLSLIRTCFQLLLFFFIFDIMKHRISQIYKTMPYVSHFWTASPSKKARARPYYCRCSGKIEKAIPSNDSFKSFYVNGCAYVFHTLYDKFYYYQNVRKWQCQEYHARIPRNPRMQEFHLLLE